VVDKKIKKIRVGTVFSGIGAIEHALKIAKIPHEIMFAGDIDKFVKQSYFANYKIDPNRWHDDIEVFAKHEAKKHFNKIDLLVGGSPCQSFSMAGKRDGLDDARGTLFYSFAKVIDEVRPKVFIYENVKGLLNHDSGKTWKIIKKVFENDLEYEIFAGVLNAKHYGIPQSRERIFVVGFKKSNVKFQFPKPKKLTKTMQHFLEDNVDKKYLLPKKGVAFVTNEKQLKKKYTQINGEIALCQRRNQQSNWCGDFVDEKYFLSKKVKQYVLSSGTKNYSAKPETDLKVARAILQSCHKMHRAGVDNYVTYKYGKIRKLTPNECLRLMGFRNFKVVVSDLQAYRQAGNSIVVDVLKELLKEIKKTKVIIF
jgi:DNA (cytosine-5)-methyltransferase 1